MFNFAQVGSVEHQKMDSQLEDFDAAQNLLVATEMLIPDDSQQMSTEGHDCNPTEDQYTDPIVTVSEVDRQSPLVGSSHIGISNELPKQIGFAQDQPTNDGAVVVAGSAQENTSGSVLVNAYPVSMIQWNPVQFGGTVYLIGNAQVQPSVFSTGFSGGSFSHIPLTSFHNSLSLQSHTQRLYSTSQQISNQTETQTINSSFWDTTPVLQDAPLTLSTAQTENSNGLPDFSKSVQEFVSFAGVDRATLPDPSLSDRFDIEAGRRDQFCGTDEPSVQVNHQSRVSVESVSIMCSETDEETMRTDQEKLQKARQDTLIELNVPSTSKGTSWEKIMIGECSAGASSSPRTIALKSTKAGAKIPKIREPPPVTRRIDLSSLRGISPTGSLSPPVSQAEVLPSKQPFKQIKRQTTVISHSIVNITKKSPGKQDAQQIPVRPLPVLGLHVPAGSCAPAGNALKPTPTVQTSTVNPLPSAVPISLPPLSVFTAPYRIVPSSVPLLPSQVSEPRLRLPVIRTRTTRRKICNLERGASRRKRGKEPPKHISPSIEVCVNNESNIDSQGRNRIDLNARERERVSLLNDGFDTLRKVLPWSTKIGRRVSKVDTLRAAISYIDHLQTLLKESEEVTAFQPVCSGT